MLRDVPRRMMRKTEEKRLETAEFCGNSSDVEVSEQDPFRSRTGDPEIKNKLENLECRCRKHEFLTRAGFHELTTNSVLQITTIYSA
jgi:hypothetical protein